MPRPRISPPPRRKPPESPRSWRESCVLRTLRRLALLGVPALLSGCAEFREFASDIQGGARAIDSTSQYVVALTSELKHEYEQNAQRIETLADDIAGAARSSDALMERINQSTRELVAVLNKDDNGVATGLLPEFRAFVAKLDDLRCRLDATTDTFNVTALEAKNTLASWRLNEVCVSADPLVRGWGAGFCNDISRAAQNAVIGPVNADLSSCLGRVDQSLDRTKTYVTDTLEHTCANLDAIVSRNVTRAGEYLTWLPVGVALLAIPNVIAVLAYSYAVTRAALRLLTKLKDGK